MTVGAGTTTLANPILNGIRNTSFAVAATYVKLHIGDPGAAGASNAAAVTTRSQATFSAASSGAIALSNTPTFAMTTTETISHISVWDASSAGNFLWSAALSASKAVVNGDTLNMTTLGVNITPLAA